MNNLNQKYIAILMATYNGEKFIQEQIDSILAQTYQNFVLYIRDDNSKDNTTKIIRGYASKYPDKVILVEDGKIAKGACKNFMLLLEYVYKLNKHEVFMFSDQDDFWMNNKVEMTLKEYEKQDNKTVPILIHTDLCVVDQDLNTLNESFMKYSKLNEKCNKINNYLVQNNVTGCTMLLNKALVDKVNFKIKNIRMHDWYFALIASVFGKVIYIDKPTIKYRQHANNVVGAKEGKGLNYIWKSLKNSDKTKKSIDELYSQAESFLNTYNVELDEKSKKQITEFLKLRNYSKIKKIFRIIKYKFYKQGLLRIIGEFIYF